MTAWLFSFGEFMPKKRVSEGPEAKYRPKAKSKTFRKGDVLVTVTTETQPAVVDFNDVLACARVEDDDMHDPPWEEHDGHEHDAIPFGRLDGECWEHYVTVPCAAAHPLKKATASCGPHYLRVPHYNEDHVAGSGHDRYLIRVTDDHLEKWGWGPYPSEYMAAGTPKQVYLEERAEVRRRAIEQLVKWYDDGWQWYGVACEFLDYESSIWGILTEDDSPSDPYLDEVKVEMALEVAGQLEDAGFTVINQPPGVKTRADKQRELRWRICRHLGFKKPEAYRAWVEDRSVRWAVPGRRGTRKGRKRTATAG